MATLVIKDTLDQLIPSIAAGKRHIKRSTAIALTKTVVDAKDDVRASMTRAFDRPKPYTLNALMVKPATPQDLVAEIRVRDGTRFGQSVASVGVDSASRPQINWISPNIYGGGRKTKGFERWLIGAGLMPAGNYAIPTADVRKDAFGNVASSVYADLRRRLTYGPRPLTKSGRNVGNKPVPGQKYMIISEPRGKLPAGIYEIRSFQQGRGMRALFIFTSTTPAYSERVPFRQIVTQTVQQKFALRFTEAIEGAVDRFGA